MNKTALIPVANGTEEIEAIVVADTLRRANIDVTIASITENLQITATKNTKIVTDDLLKNCSNNYYDLIVLPGGMPGAENLRDCPTLISMLKEQKQSGRLYAAICAAPAVVLQHHGLLENLTATCYPISALSGQIDNYSRELVVVDKNCITSQGPGTTFKFAIKLVELLTDLKTAQKLTAEMLL